MVNRQINQEIELYTTPGKENKTKSKFTKKREEEPFIFLVFFQKQKELLSFFKNPP